MNRIWGSKIAKKIKPLGTKFKQDIKDSYFNTQKGKCAICSKVFVGFKEMHLDHCHKTGELRGLLCQNCNLGLGNFKDSPEFLRKAIDYLLKLR